MRSRTFKPLAVVIFVAALLSLTMAAQRDKEKAGESERKVTEADVPKAALNALVKMARNAEITEFAEEIEHGSTFYEGSWKNKAGANVDVLVTKAGAVVEIEESIPADKVPAAALKAAKKAAGENAKFSCEKKTMILYEIKFTKDGASHEVLLTPDGRIAEEEIEKGKSKDGNGDDGQKAKKVKAAANDDEEDADADDDKKEKKMKAAVNDNDDEDADDEDEDADDDDADDDEDEDADADDDDADDDEDADAEDADDDDKDAEDEDEDAEDADDDKDADDEDEDADDKDADDDDADDDDESK